MCRKKSRIKVNPENPFCDLCGCREGGRAGGAGGEGESCQLGDKGEGETTRQYKPRERSPPSPRESSSFPPWTVNGPGCNVTLTVLYLYYSIITKA